MKHQEQLTRAVIEAIHGCKWEEAILKEPDWCNDEGDECCHKPIITLGRILQALYKNLEFKEPTYFVLESGYVCRFSKDDEVGTYQVVCDWALIKDSGEECTLKDQSDETVTELLNLLTK